MGVAILPRSDAVAPGAEVAVVGLTEPPLSRDITLAWRQGRRHPPAVTEFLALARATFSGDRGQEEPVAVSASGGRRSAYGRAAST
jgi:DNA-binding transcriptional LysR family regulator